MKVLVPEIATHVQEGGEGRNQEILSVDVHPELPVVVSAGAGENRVIFWKLNTDAKDGAEWLTFLAEMTALTFENTVNIVRFSPCGRYLACGDSNGLVSILSLKEECKSWTDVQDERNMRRVHLRGHTMDVQDFAWSPNSKYCVSAAMDNFVIVWDALKCTEVQRLKEHTHYAQGVAWSPDGLFIASASFDETVRINRVTYKNKKVVGCQEVAVLKKPKLFADEFRAPTFSRRLTFSPEAWSGLLAVPGGLTTDPNLVQAAAETTKVENGAAKGGDEESEAKAEEKKSKSIAATSPATHMFRFVNNHLVSTTPVATLSGFAQPSLAIRFHPLTFKPIQAEGVSGVNPWASFTSSSRLEEARFVFAVATIDSVLIYDTQHPRPIAAVEKLHYASYTDLAWSISKDGSCALVASSRDGCYSILRFDKGELGETYERIAPAVQEQQETTDAKEENVSCDVPHSPVQAEAQKTERRSPAVLDENSRSSQGTKKRRIQLESLGPTSSSSPSRSAASASSIVEKPVINTLQPRRVKLETIQPL